MQGRLTVTDELVERALEQDLDREPSIWHDVALVFRGRFSRWNALFAIFELALYALAIIAAFRFFAVTTTQDHIFWATVFLAGVVIGSLVDMWFWMQINRTAVLRGIKRVELKLEEHTVT